MSAQDFDQLTGFRERRAGSSLVDEAKIAASPLFQQACQHDYGALGHGLIRWHQHPCAGERKGARRIVTES